MIYLPAPIFVVILIVVFLFGMVFSTFLESIKTENQKTPAQYEQQMSKLNKQVDVLLELCSK